MEEMWKKFSLSEEEKGILAVKNLAYRKRKNFFWQLAPIRYQTPNNVQNSVFCSSYKQGIQQGSFQIHHLETMVWFARCYY